MRGDTGINPLDEGCKLHDMAYSQTKNISERHKPDKVLEEAARQRLKSSDSNIGDKMAVLGVKGVMKMKRKMGMAMKRSKRSGVMKIKRKMGMGIKRISNKKRLILKERIIPSPKKGGFLPLLIPLFGALGAVGGGATSIAKAVNDAKVKKMQLEEQKRHDLAMEQGYIGKGLYLRPYKGYGLYLKPFQKNSR